jgi:hypothetical protein
MYLHHLQEIDMKRLMLSVLVSPVILLGGCWGSGDGEGYRRNLAITKPLNDTGISLCGDYAFPDATHNNSTGCQGSTQTVDGIEIGNGLDPIPAGQDAHFGRDVTDNDSDDGFKGFSFTKLGNNGAALAIQGGSYSDIGLEAVGTKWSCVRDNVTGLVWEMKTNDVVAGLRDKDWTYTWYNSDSTGNGGNAGAPDIDTGSSDNCYYQESCDTEKYVAYINSAYLCGANDWRLPTRAELKTLRHLGVSSPAIDHDYFPNTPANSFWTASTRASDADYAWRTDFNSGADEVSVKSSAFSVRLVRDAE